MHTLWCLPVSAAVSQMRLCSSLSVVAHMICRVVCSFSTWSCFFLKTCLFRTLVRNFSFELLFRRLKFESTISGLRVGIRLGFQVRGRMGVVVSGCLFFCSDLFASACLPALGACLPALGCLYAYLDQTELVVIFLSSSVGVDSVAQRIRVGSRIGTPSWNQNHDSLLILYK